MSIILYPCMKRINKKNAKLSDNDIVNIKRLRNNGMTLKEIGRKYGVVASTVFFVTNEKASRKHNAIVVQNTLARLKGDKKYAKRFFELHRTAQNRRRHADVRLQEYSRKKMNENNKINRKRR